MSLLDPSTARVGSLDGYQLEVLKWLLAWLGVEEYATGRGNGLTTVRRDPLAAVTDLAVKVHADPAVMAVVRGWLADVEDELRRQDEFLDAADLELAGGHRPYVDCDDMAPPGAQWHLYCDCGHGEPVYTGDEAGAYRALAEHPGVPID